MENKLIGFIDYHIMSSDALDIDPANDCLLYICDRYDLNIEQRYWIAFLYACTYSATTAFYIYNEFPDYENVNVDRMINWWNENKDKTIFQTDRRWIKSRNQFVDCFVSYKAFVGSITQHQKFSTMNTGNPTMSYDICIKECEKIFTFGRFTLFLYMEQLKNLTGFDIEPNTIELDKAESSRNGLCFAIGRDELSTHGSDKKLTNPQKAFLQNELYKIISQVKNSECKHKSIWSIETTLCAYKKYVLGKRWIGYYIERQKNEIIKLQALVRDGVCWDVLWQFRKETYEKQYTQNDLNCW